MLIANTCGCAGFRLAACLLADGGPAPHWQAADRHGQEAEACTALLLNCDVPLWQ